jgi:hypothetical protein
VYSLSRAAVVKLACVTSRRRLSCRLARSDIGSLLKRRASTFGEISWQSGTPGAQRLTLIILRGGPCVLAALPRCSRRVAAKFTSASAVSCPSVPKPRAAAPCAWKVGMRTRDVDCDCGCVDVLASLFLLLLLVCCGPPCLIVAHPT